MKTTAVFFYMTFVFSICISSAQGQIPILESEAILDKLRLNKGINGVETLQYSNLTGDPYLFKDFKKGKLVVLSGAKFDVTIRYDIYANEMHLQNKGEIFAIIHPEKVNRIETDSLTFIYSKLIKSQGEETTKDGSYFILQADGKCKLLIKKNMRIQDPEPPKLYQDAKPPKFVNTSDTYYLKLKDASAVRIKNEKDLFAVLGDEEKALSQFIHSNRLKIKNLEDLVKIVTYYNGL
ncbi:MAG: hypothetical protein WCJ95_09420 [Mariniphaga sp.]